MDDYRAESELGALSRDLLADLERLRPGLPEADSATELQAAVSARAHLRLEELYREQFAAATAEDEQAAQRELLRREIDQILVPRYAALAHRQNQIERHRPAPLSGGDLFNRVAYATIFFLIGVFVVWAPFIPIWEKWVPFALSGLAATFAQALPDLHRALHLRRHRVQLLTLMVDLDQAGRALPAGAPGPAALPSHGPPPQAGSAKESAR